MTASTALERRVAAALRRHRFTPGTGIVVGASGGPDSTALLRCLHRLRGEFSLSLHVAHLNHDFRGAEADHDAAFVQRLADGLGLPCSIDKQDPIAYQRVQGVSSFEQAAREMRYSFLASVASSVGADAVALGHTSDDQSETVLIHLLRGSGLHGLRGMAEVAEWPWPEPRPGPLLFRPLLSVTKEDTVAYCRSLGQTYREDSGNYMWRFTRNKVRHDLLPRLARDYNPRVREALERLSRVASAQVDFIDKELEGHWNEISVETGGAVSFEAETLASIHPALQRQAIRRAYSSLTGDSRGLNESHVEAVTSLLHRGRGGRGIHLPRNVRVEFQGGRLRISAADAPTIPPRLFGEHSLRLPSKPGDVLEAAIGEWRLAVKIPEPGQHPAGEAAGGDEFTARLDREALGGTATIRSRLPGDRFQPKGMAGSKKLQDFFTDAKIPRDQRDGIPLLVTDLGIAWVVGHRVADWAAPREGAESVSVSFKPTEARGRVATQPEGC